jgi:acyl-CoA reductase-like NAD-dependent aldehyde dehydrogenase
VLEHPGGGRLAIGGQPVDGPGYFYPATIIGDAGPDAPVAIEEVFGPITAFMRARDEAAAIELANASVFGLGAAVWTGDVERGLGDGLRHDGRQRRVGRASYSTMFPFERLPPPI